MGRIYVTAKLSNIEKTRAKEVKALADTGATLTVIPQRIANELGLSEVSKEVVENTAGEIELKRSSARITISGKETLLSGEAISGWRVEKKVEKNGKKGA